MIRVPIADLPSGVINIRYETFSLDLAAAAALMRTDVPDSTLYKNVVELVTNGKARQENLAILRTRSGMRSKCESIAEYIYPTEWDPAEIPQNIGIKVDSPTANSDGKETPKPEEEVIPLFTTPATGTAFETRNTGFTIEADTVIGQDNKTIEMSIAPGHVNLTGTSKWGQGVSELEVPDFETQKLTTSVIMQVGVPRLLGTMNRTPASKVDGGSAKRIWFAFVTASLAR